MKYQNDDIKNNYDFSKNEYEITDADKIKLFQFIENHLLADERPSVYLQLASNDKVFKSTPFHMLYRLHSTPQSPVYHPEGNAWIHTLMVVDKAAKVKNRSKNARVFMWAALLHDIGKPDTTKNRKGKITSYEHDRKGYELSRQFLSFFTDNSEFINDVSFLVRYHMQILFVNKNLPFAKITEMKNEGDINEVALLGLCDRLGRTNTDQKAEEKQIELFLNRCKKQNSRNHE